MRIIKTIFEKNTMHACTNNLLIEILNNENDYYNQFIDNGDQLVRNNHAILHAELVNIYSANEKKLLVIRDNLCDAIKLILKLDHKLVPKKRTNYKKNIDDIINLLTIYVERKTVKSVSTTTINEIYKKVTNISSDSNHNDGDHNSNIMNSNDNSIDILETQALNNINNNIIHSNHDTQGTCMHDDDKADVNNDLINLSVMITTLNNQRKQDRLHIDILTNQMQTLMDENKMLKNQIVDLNNNLENIKAINSKNCNSYKEFEEHSKMMFKQEELINKIMSQMQTHEKMIYNCNYELMLDRLDERIAAYEVVANNFDVKLKNLEHGQQECMNNINEIKKEIEVIPQSIANKNENINVIDAKFNNEKLKFDKSTGKTKDTNISKFHNNNLGETRAKTYADQAKKASNAQLKQQQASNMQVKQQHQQNKTNKINRTLASKNKYQNVNTKESSNKRHYKINANYDNKWCNMYVGHLDKTFTVDDLNHLLIRNDIWANNITKLDTKHGYFNSFSFVIPQQKVKLMFNRSFWPNKAVCRYFYK